MHGIAVQVCELKIVDHIIDFHFVWIGRIDAELCLKLPVLVELHGGKGIEPFDRGGDRIHFHFYFAQVVVERHFVRIVAQVHGTSRDPELVDPIGIVKRNRIGRRFHHQMQQIDIRIFHGHIEAGFIQLQQIKPEVKFHRIAVSHDDIGTFCAHNFVAIQIACGKIRRMTLPAKQQGIKFVDIPRQVKISSCQACHFLDMKIGLCIRKEG